MLSRLRDHVRHNVVGYVALFFAFSGGAFAANTYIRTTDAIPSSSDLTGTYGSPLIAADKVNSGKVLNDSLTGSDIDESSLGKVGDANTLDGLDSSAFTPASEVKNSGRVVVNDTNPDADQGTGAFLFNIGPFAVSARCAQDYTLSGGDDFAQLVVDGPGNSSFVGPRAGVPDFTLSSGGQGEVAQVQSSVPKVAGGQIIAVAPSGSVVSVSGSAEVDDPDGDCVFGAIGLGH
jgi:hypothetical protein